MAPMDDPQVAVLVIVDSPKGVHYGNLTAGPGVKSILTNTLKYLKVEPIYAGRRGSGSRCGKGDCAGSGRSELHFRRGTLRKLGLTAVAALREMKSSRL